jgi:hypothetical protein
VAAWVPDMFCKFYFVKNHKIASNSVNTEAGEKISADLESFEFLKKIVVRLTKYENYQILIHKIGHRFLVTIKLLSG